MGDSEIRDSLGAYVFEHRFELLLPEWLVERARDYEMSDRSMPWPEWLAENAADDLEAFLSSAEALAFEQLLQADPLLLVSRLAGRLGGIEKATGNEPGKVLVWARGSDSPLKPEVQQALFTAINDAQIQLGSEDGDPGLTWTGVARFAAQSREKITSEVTRLNVLSLLAVLAVAAVCLRHAHKILHVIPVVVCSLLGAWAATTFFIPRVHILVLVVGALLCGIAIDYALHVYLHPLREGDDFSKRLRAIIKPLLVGAFTTAIGFSFLLLAELPFIRHLGVFVTTGLFCAIASAILWV
jgi:predicted exporter